MTVAIPVWQGKTSPLMDYATTLMLIEYNDGQELHRREIPLVDEFPSTRAQRLVDLGTEVLICGGISRSLLSLITSKGISVVPWVSGDIQRLLDAFRAGRLSVPEYAMPGRGALQRGRRRCSGNKPRHKRRSVDRREHIQRRHNRGQGRKSA